MRLSIVTINYNNLEGLKKTANSILSQTFRDFEWIVIDGGSKDGSADFILELSHNPKANISFFVSEKDSGIYNALNKGTGHCAGDYINCMNSGDCYVDENILYNVFNVPRTADVLYGDTYYETEKGDWRLVQFEKKIDKWFFAKIGWINHQSAFIRRTLCERTLYEESYKICADTNFFFHLAINGAIFEHLQSVVAKFEYGGVSNNKWDNPKETVVYLEANLREMLSLGDRSFERNTDLIFDREILDVIYDKKLDSDYPKYENAILEILSRLFSQGHNGIQWYSYQQLLATDSFLLRYFPKIHSLLTEKEIFIHAMTRRIPIAQFRCIWWRLIVLYPRHYMKEVYSSILKLKF